MRLNSATLRNYRVHRELKVELDPSRTLIGGPNESGKSTLIEAVHRALFLKAKGNTENHRAMVSLLSVAHPEVELVFEAGRKSYLLKKRFGGMGNTTLACTGEAQLSGDAAEVELARILCTEAGIAGKALAGQWAHLWVWQGKADEDPSAHATAQKGGLLQRLQQMGGAAALQSDLDTRVANRFAELRDQIFTQAGKPKAGSELERAETADTLAQEKLAIAKERVRKLVATASDYENATQDLSTSTVSLGLLETQKEEADAKAQQLLELRNLEIEQMRSAKAGAQRCGDLDSADRQIQKARTDIAEIEAALKPQDEAIAALEISSRDANASAAKAESEYVKVCGAARSCRMRSELVSAYIQLFEKTEVQSKLNEKAAKAFKFRRALSELEEQLAKLPKVDKAKLNKIQKQQMECSNALASLRAMATGIEVISTDKPVKADGHTIKVGQQQILSDVTDVRIGAVVHLRIQPGGGSSLAEARKAETSARAALQGTLDELGIASASLASEIHAERDEKAAKLKNINAELDGMDAENLGEELQIIQNEVAATKSLVERLAALVENVPPPKEKSAARTLAKSLEKERSETEDQEANATAMRDRCAMASATAAGTLTEKRSQIDQQKLKLNGMLAQLDLLLKTHGEDAARSRDLSDCQSAQREVLNLLKKTSAAIAALQPHLLEADRIRIARAIKQATSDQNEARTKIAVAKAALNSDGSEDPSSDLATAEVKARSADEHRKNVMRRAQAINLLCESFQEEQRGLAKKYTQPFADKIGDYLQCIFGAGTHAQVEMDDSGFTGLRLCRPGFGAGTVDFEALSGGAREQTAAAVRLAMAEVLAADFDECLPLVFDDAFAYSDPRRVIELQRMLDLAATRGLQVIVLTCNPADYAALGARTVTLQAAG